MLLFYIKGLKVMDILVETSVIFFIILCESFVLPILMIGGVRRCTGLLCRRYSSVVMKCL